MTKQSVNSLSRWRPGFVLSFDDDMDGWIVGGEWQAAKQTVNCEKSDLVVRVPVPQVRAAGGTGATESNE